ncbi:uncharacterized protein LAESUDRAFT_643958 [Laetiporus sulphureus 93-53]|uniref:Spo11/DNA topoisomerase VI subunit A N-terminal domain-containing protein n=1 Tax=Laetiporus sulphureus 93-53 TaxID=1314785 RepID=A0A165H0F9_9APHY|nr:uncharacterized protein LAESUDRAFT_643958 [Laetiporus sulphureus 93-53]KZT11079.1 hypothetical protein LAESUDRAFT_643958 [Laetiporus sulphureus 93-53]
MTLNSDFSSNRHAADLQEYEVPVRHPELSFEDANVAIVAGRQYFLVHQGVLCRHSPALRKQLGCKGSFGGKMIEGCPVLTLQDAPEDVGYFLQALYGFFPKLEGKDFSITSALLRISTKYAVAELRKEVIRVLTLSWPTTLALWEAREKKATNLNGIYARRPAMPHPISIVTLARETNVPELLPSAFYDLSRYMPSQITFGCIGIVDDLHHQLDMDDLLRVLRGKEQAARFFSTFIVNELEGRDPSDDCLRRRETCQSTQRACQVAFEAVNFELIRDINGVVCNRNSDPLFAMLETVLMQTRGDLPGIENKAVYRACEVCRLEYGAMVSALREEFWRRLPDWFELEVQNWAVAEDSRFGTLLHLSNIDRLCTMDMIDDLASDPVDAIAPTLSDDGDSDEPDILWKFDLEESYSDGMLAVLSDNEELDNAHQQDMDNCELEDEELNAVDRIENLILSLMSQLSDCISQSPDSVEKKKEKKVVLKLADRRKSSTNGFYATRTMKYPQRRQGGSIKPFAQLLRVADLMHEALHEDVPTTKRDMYYKDVQLFKSQSVVDRVVDDLAATFELGRADLHVRASSKGLVSGYGLVMHLQDGNCIEVHTAEVCHTWLTILQLN